MAHIEPLCLVLSNMALGVMYVDGGGMVRFINPFGRELLGIRERERVEGTHVQTLIPILSETGRTLSFKERPLGMALIQEKVVTSDRFWYTSRHPKPRRVPVSVTAAPITSGGSVHGALAIFRDLSDERLSSWSKNEFISLASHQLRTPLSIIALNLDVLTTSPLYRKASEHEREFFNDIKDATSRMIELVDMLLSVSRIELGAFEMRTTPTSIPDIFKKELKHLEKKIAEKKLRVSIALEPRFPKVSTDRQLLTIVIQNLLSNAIKYSYPGKTIRVSAKRMDTQVRISVRDHGIGIPENQRGKVFSKLFRADNVEEVRERGTGLGLYVARSITELLGGNIGFNTPKGGGTEFWIELPLRRSGTNNV